MYTEVVQYSGMPAAVSMIARPDGCAEYRLARDVETVQDHDGNPVIQGTEVYFEITAGLPQPTADDVAANFDAYWSAGAHWPVAPQTTEERIKALEGDNLALADALATMYEVMLGGDML